MSAWHEARTDQPQKYYLYASTGREEAVAERLVRKVLSSSLGSEQALSCEFQCPVSASAHVHPVLTGTALQLRSEGALGSFGFLNDARRVRAVFFGNTLKLFAGMEVGWLAGFASRSHFSRA